VKILRITYSHNLLTVTAMGADGTEYEASEATTETENLELVGSNIAAAFERVETELKA
jgi:hypothetical protein